MKKIKIIVEFDVEDQYKENIQIELGDSINELLVDYQLSKKIGNFSITEGSINYNK